MAASQGVSQEAAIAVLAILGARDHYAAIDAPRDASLAELRRCYLKASILVHPDKNCHPDATRAFQRVAAAWATLADEDKRRAYDYELVEGDQSDDIQMTPEEAFAAFAFAAACAAGGAGGAGAAVGNMAETLFWAQQLGQMNGCGQGPVSPMPAFGFPSPCPYGPYVAAPAAGSVAASFGGIALSVGLWSAGLAISIVGLPRIGGFARRLALLQGISQVVIVSQVPAVRTAACTAASLGAARVQEAAGYFADQHPQMSSIAKKVKARICESADSLHHVVDSHISIAGVAERVKTHGTAAVTKVRRLVDQSCKTSDIWPGQSCLGWNPEESDSEEEDTWYVQNMRLRRQRTWKPRAGTWVKLSNLQRARHLEGSLGEVLAFDRDSGRYLVQLFPLKNTPKDSSPEPDEPHEPREPPEPPVVSKLVLLQNLRPAFDRSSKPPSSETHFI
ncbi:HLJ1 [Symbiodinium natans]|uniref:HLJ1 protein n=1 Tax=Symbiodinium natans TaxID=878477 RepID=A0A812I2X8_9DINO|nr:HLJ1 [Symbiodinium natans]